MIWKMVSCQKLLPPQNERTATGGNWIILPFMCETGGPAVPCVYTLLSLTWCNGTCGNDSGGDGSAAGITENAPFCCNIAPYLNITGAWTARRPPPDLLTTTPRRNRISSFLTSETVKKQKQNTSPLLPWRINTWGHNQRHCFIMFGRVSRHIFCRICNVFFSARSSVLSQQITKAPEKHSPCFYNSAPQPRRWMSLGLSSVRNTCLLFH